MAQNIPIFTNACAWLHDAWTILLSTLVVVLLAYSVIPVVFLNRSPPPPSALRAPPFTHRGSQQATAYAPLYGPFYPDLPLFEDGDALPAVFCVLLGFIDNVVRPATGLVWAGMNTALLLAGKVNRTFSRPYLVQTFVLPLKTHVRQTIAQMPVPTIPTSGVPYRYICPAFFLLALLNVMVAMFGVSILFAGLLCFVGGMTLFAADRMGVVEDEDEESVSSGADSTPEMAGAGQVLALHGQA